MKEEKYYLVVIECGHVGAKRTIEIDRYFKDYDILSVYDSAKMMPRSKKKELSVKYIREISFDDYIQGKTKESDNLYLNSIAI